MQLDSDVKSKSLALNTFKVCTQNGCVAGPSGVIVGYVSRFTTSPVNILIPATLELGSGPPFPVAPTPCLSSEMMQELPAHVVVAVRPGKSGRWEKSILCHLTVSHSPYREMEAQSSKGRAPEDAC